LAQEPRSLRDELAALRIDRSAPATPGPPARRRAAWAAAALLGLGLLALAAWHLLGPGPRPVAVGYAVRSEGTASGGAGPVLSGSGYVVTGEKYISIGVRVAGRIEAYLVDEADRVKAGQALVRLDSRDYEAALERAEAQLRLARATVELRRKELVRLRELRQRDVASQAELDVKETELRVAEAEAARAEAEVAQTRVSLDYTVLRAPVDGVILAKLKEVGEIAVPGGFAGSGDLIRMANLDDLRAEVDVNEADLARVRLGQDATVVPDAFPDRRYQARVVKLYPQVNRQKGTLKVEVAVLEPDSILLPDMSVRIHFLGEPVTAQPGMAVVLAPRDALRSDAGGDFVWVVSGGRARRQPVRRGGEQGEQVAVVEGLLGGEALVRGEVPELAEGDAVEPLPGSG
jgi:RND family efflux transporter MFP subunit